MNCKPGDLAVVIESSTGDSVGKILTCVRLSGRPGLHNLDGTFDAGPVWETSDFTPDPVTGIPHNYWMDSALRPIRDQPGNEQFVVEARKSLPRPATAKGDTITERGDLA